MNRLLERFVDFFVITFGITRPKPGQEKIAAFFILGLIVLIFGLIFAGVVLLVRTLA